MIWGFVNGIFVILDNFIFKKHFKDSIVASGRFIPTFKEFSQIILTFILVSLINSFLFSGNLNHCIFQYKNLGFFIVFINFIIFRICTLNCSLLKFVFWRKIILFSFKLNWYCIGFNIIKIRFNFLKGKKIRYTLNETFWI